MRFAIAIDGPGYNLFVLGHSALSGVPAEEADAAGVPPRGTVNFRVEARLAELSAMRRDYGVDGRPRRHGDSDTGRRHAPARSVKRGV